MSHVLVNPDKTKWNTQWSSNGQEMRKKTLAEINQKVNNTTGQ